LKQVKPEAIGRIIDANLNRLKEGLRVCEEITRFILGNRSLTGDLKAIRHEVDGAVSGLACRRRLLMTRDSLGDVGRDINSKKEFRRKDYRDIFFANIQRVKESLRVLEEFLKLEKKSQALRFKQIRYEVYAIEKKFSGRLSSRR
jgi:thiamine-phosphate pyrophosphorylase